MITACNGITPDIEKAAFIAENAVICGDVVLEEGVSVWYGAVLRGDVGTIRIGRNTNIQDNCVIHTDHGGCTEIGANVTVGHGAIVHGCTIGDGCVIGMGAILMNDAVIGEHCLVGAGSLVTNGKVFAPNSVIMGSPARTVMPVTAAHLESMQHSAEEYLRLSGMYQETGSCSNDPGSMTGSGSGCANGRDAENLCSSSGCAGDSDAGCVNGIDTMIETKRLILRPWTEVDAEDCYLYAKDPRVGPIAGWPVHTSVENSRQIIRDVLAVPETYAIVLKETGQPIGSVGLHFHCDLAREDDEAELGYWLGVPYWGCGLVPEAAWEMLRHAFEDLHLKRVWCGYYDGNERSKRVQEKLGFRYQWTSEDAPVPQMGETRKGHVNCMTKEEWQAMQ